MSAKTKTVTSVPPVGEWGRRLALACGLLVGLCLLKFGTPIVLPQAYESPGVFSDWFSGQWPLPIAYFLLAGLVVYGLIGARTPDKLPSWQVWVPAAWLGWQIVATFTSKTPGISTTVLLHLATVVACYYVGLLALSRLTDGRHFWWPIGISLLLVMWTAFGQHYGGTASTAQYIEENQATGWTNLPPNELQDLVQSGVVVKTEAGTYTVVEEVLKRAKGGRVSGTFSYANALAGILLLAIPACLVVLWRSTEKLPKLSRMVAVGLVLYIGGACLVWSGSKAGWLVAMIMLIAILLAQPIPKQWKLGILAVMLVVGIGGFVVKYQNKLKNPTSVAARFDYWSAAVKLTAERPLLGQGPGAFGQGYARLKRPESEPTRLAHNDYLEQACDSGLPGFALFLAWIGGSLVLVWKKGMHPDADGLIQAMALGVIGWALQSFVEFSLYIPAIGWTAMLMLGWLTGMPAPQTASTDSK